MGLDNGIRMRNVTKEQVMEIPDFIICEKYLDKETNTYDIELAYWRKCWGIRNAIINKLHMGGNYYYPIDREDIPAIIRILYPFLSKEYWDEESDSIWEFDEQIDTMIQIIINLKWLYSFMENNNIKVEFYDSF